MALNGPVVARPRLDAKLWGGDRLRRFGLGLDGPEPLGEALATAGESRLGDGEETLGDLVAAAPEAVAGERGLAATGGRPLFPLLVKLVDAGQVLSVQVHPDDEAARPLDRLGKTEAWHVLDAAPGAVLYAGMRPDVGVEEFAAACRAGEGGVGELLLRLPAVPGTTLLLPAGTMHALGAGVLVYEVQQPSEITYRVCDWARVAVDGRPRELHVEVGLAALDASLRPEPIAPLPLASGAGRRHLLAACRYFALERIALAAGERVTGSASASPQTLTCLRGALEVVAAEGAVTVPAGGTGVVPASIAEAAIRALAPAVALRSWVPDLAAEVVAPARAAGHGDEAIARLAGPLPDVRRAMAEAGGG